MVLESIAGFIKSLPAWLGAVTEILIVAIVFLTAVTFISGLWVGIRIVGKRMRHIKELQFMPPKIVFDNAEHPEE